MIPFPIYLFILIELFFVSWGDIKTEKIPNIWSLLNIVSFLILLFVAPKFYFFSIEVFLYPLIFLFIGFILFVLKIMGGGDSKYLSSFFLIIPNGIHDLFFENLLLSTVLIGSFVFVTNFVKNFDEIISSLKNQNFQQVKSYFGSKFSYAPVILLAWIWIGWKINILNL